MSNWPPEYVGELLRRQELLERINASRNMQRGAMEYYRDHPVAFINDWCLTYDPRNAFSDDPTTLPFCLFPRQEALVGFLYSCINDSENGLIEKSRDMGASWLCCAVSVHLWLFYSGAAVGWGSRKEELVDRIGDMKAIFPKIRFIIENLPGFLRPKGFDMDRHMPFMKVINPENGAGITGESGDNIGRGGRTLIYFKDESAHYDRPEKIEAALADNTNVQIDISSVNGVGNVFYRRRMSGTEWTPGADIPSGVTRIFVMDWRHHPHKDQDWYDKRRQKAEVEGLTHIFAQEIDRDYAAAKTGTIIKSAWVKAAIDAHIKLKFKPGGKRVAALDVADDEGEDLNAWGYLEGNILRRIETWGGIDTTVTAQKANDLCDMYAIDEMQYDCIGVGAGVKGETNRLKRNGQVRKSLTISPWAASGAVLWPTQRVNRNDPESRTNKDFFENLKAQAYWRFATALFKTYRAVTFGDEYDEDELISIDSSMEGLHDFERELCQPERKQTNKGKMLVDKKPPGTKSPNKADCAVMMYTPAQISRVIIG